MRQLSLQKNNLSMYFIGVKIVARIEKEKLSEILVYGRYSLKMLQYVREERN